MNFTEFITLFLVWIISLTFILILIWRDFRLVRFNFNIFFSVLFLLIFYFGFPITSLLVFFYNIEVVSSEFLLQALFFSGIFYAIYYMSYKIHLCARQTICENSLFSFNKVEAHLIWNILALLSLFALTIFFIHNGFLLFRLHNYSQIFSNEVYGVALKRFFYFFIPAMLIVYFLQPGRRSWIIFLFSTFIFSLLTYAITGGTRANIIIAFSLALFIGIIHKRVNIWLLTVASILGIIGAFWLALCRYNLNISTSEVVYTFLYLTRDTFSPWENLALLLKQYNDIRFQGFTPIIYDFYVYIPRWIWLRRPSLVLNSANYFTWEILHNYSGLTISPTLIGSLLIMGGITFIPLGAIIVGLIIKWFDWIYELSKKSTNRYTSAIFQSFCFGAVFNIIVLAREGMDSFFSRAVFFFLIFACCLTISKLFYWILNSSDLIRFHQ